LETLSDDVDLGRDRALVERHQAGDGGAFHELYETYFRRLCRFCERRVHDSALAEDLAQESFARAMARLDELGGDRRFYPWLTVIAGRLCIDHHRRHGRVDPVPFVELPPAGGDHAERLVAEVDRAHLSSALGRLNPRHREVLRLREFDELRYDGIATELGVPASTVEALLHRARRALRREFFAVSGEGPTAVAGIGVVAWVVRLVLRTKRRGAAAAPVPVAAAVLTVAAVTLVPQLSDDPEAPDAGRPDPVAETVVGPPMRPVAGTTDPAPTGPLGSAGDRSAAEPVADEVGPVTMAAGPAEVHLGSDGAKDRAEQMPLAAAVGPLVAGADLDAAITDTAETLSDQLVPLGGQP
jgi:RNA polymerase sigma-70 factor (ECF subfamily)